MPHLQIFIRNSFVASTFKRTGAWGKSQIYVYDLKSAAMTFNLPSFYGVTLDQFFPHNQYNDTEHNSIQPNVTKHYDT
jgi:hypothetical protein